MPARGTLDSGLDPERKPTPHEKNLIHIAVETAMYWLARARSQPKEPHEQEDPFKDTLEGGSGGEQQG